MGKVLVFVVLLVVLISTFQKVANWFQYTRNINIVPFAFVEMVSVFLFVFNYGGESTEEIIWVWVSVAIVLAVTLFNLIKYGLQNGLLASLTELVFSVAIVFAILGILVSRNQKTKRRNRRKY